MIVCVCLGCRGDAYMYVVVNSSRCAGELRALGRWARVGAALGPWPLVLALVPRRIRGNFAWQDAFGGVEASLMPSANLNTNIHIHINIRHRIRFNIFLFIFVSIFISIWFFVFAFVFINVAFFVASGNALRWRVDLGFAEIGTLSAKHTGFQKHTKAKTNH